MIVAHLFVSKHVSMEVSAPHLTPVHVHPSGQATIVAIQFASKVVFLRMESLHLILMKLMALVLLVQKDTI